VSNETDMDVNYGWKEISSAPKDKDIDLWNGSRITNGYWGKAGLGKATWLFDEYESGYGYTPRVIHPKPTHWMPLPAPPEA